MTIVDCTLLAEVNMINAGVVGLLAIVVLVFAILSTKNWHWVNIVLLILTLIVSITSVIGMTQVFKHRRDGMLAYEKQRKAAERAEAEVAKIIGGDPLSIKYDTGSLRDNNNQLALAMTGRGRAWRGSDVSVAEGDGNQRTVTLKNERNLEDEASLDGAVLYAFAEKDNLPVRYIGSVFVTAETKNDFTIQPVALVDTQRYDDPRVKWTLFEKMPQDQHDIFKEALKSSVNNEEGNAENSPESQQRKAFVESMKDQSKELNIDDFTEILKRDFLPAGNLGYDPDSAAYEQMIDRYAFDGQSIGKIEQYIEAHPERKNREFEPTPEEVFIKFKFSADSEVAVQTDGIGSLANDGVFNPAGEAVVGVLMQNPTGVVFKANDVILIDEPSSVEFENTHAGKLKRVDRIYVRQLQDFPLMFENMKLRAARFDQEIIVTQATTAKTQAAIKNAGQQIEVRTDLLAKSTEDEERLTKDAQNLTATLERMRQRSNEKAQQIEAAKAKNDSLYQRIKDQMLQRLRSAVSVGSN